MAVCHTPSTHSADRRHLRNCPLLLAQNICQKSRPLLLLDTLLKTYLDSGGGSQHLLDCFLTLQRFSIRVETFFILALNSHPAQALHGHPQLCIYSPLSPRFIPRHRIFLAIRPAALRPLRQRGIGASEIFIFSTTTPTIYYDVRRAFSITTCTFPFHFPGRSMTSYLR